MVGLFITHYSNYTACLSLGLIKQISQYVYFISLFFIWELKTITKEKIENNDYKKKLEIMIVTLFAKIQLQAYLTIFPATYSTSSS